MRLFGVDYGAEQAHSVMENRSVLFEVHGALKGETKKLAAPAG